MGNQILPSCKQDGDTVKPPPSCRIIAWEVTRRCNLSCKHCRASARDIPYENELSGVEARNLIQSFKGLGSPLVIFTGGEPLLRPDLFELIGLTTSLGLRAALSVNGTLVNDSVAKRIVDSRVSRCSISLDGENADVHDRFRGMPGAFKEALRGISVLKHFGVPVQINTTITAHNAASLPAIFDLCKHLGAVAWHVFLLVPVGRGKDLTVMSPHEYEQVLAWINTISLSSELEIKTTCAPQYNRLHARQQLSHNRADKSVAGHHVGRGCLGGIGFCFISHVGIVQPCGYLELECGNVRKQNFGEIWQNSFVFNQLRNQEKYPGKCGKCSYHAVCGGCRARAYEQSGNYLEDDPVCLFS